MESNGNFIRMKYTSCLRNHSLQNANSAFHKCLHNCEAYFGLVILFVQRAGGMFFMRQHGFLP